MTSIRLDYAQTFLDFVKSNGLVHPDDKDKPDSERITKGPRNKFYRIRFFREYEIPAYKGLRSCTKTLVGEIRVYSPHWIQIYSGRNRIFDNIVNALMYMKLAVVDLNWQAAVNIPEKPCKVY